MKRLLAGLAILLALPLVFAGCTRVNPGPVTTRSFDYTGFSKVEIGSAFRVEVVQSDTWSISITAQEKLFDRVSVSESGDMLQINLSWGWGTWVSSWGYQRPTARITMPELNALSISGASDGTAKGFRSSHDTNITVSGASNLEIDIEAANSRIEVSGASRLEGTLKTSGDVRAQITGASRAKLEGSARSLTLEGSGASNANMENLAVQDADVEMSGASHATVSPEDTMRVSLSGASSLSYTGNPALEAIEVSGASTIHKKS